MNTAVLCDKPAPMARAGLSAMSLVIDSGELWVVSGTSTWLVEVDEDTSMLLCGSREGLVILPFLLSPPPALLLPPPGLGSVWPSDTSLFWTSVPSASSALWPAATPVPTAAPPPAAAPDSCLDEMMRCLTLEHF